MVFVIGKEGRGCKGVNKLEGISVLVLCMLIVYKVFSDIVILIRERVIIYDNFV